MNQPLSDSAKKILQCCRQGQLNQMLDLLDTGLDIEAVNHPDFAPLNVALKNGRWKIAKYLLENQMVPHKTKCPPLIAATQYKKDLTQGLKLVFSHTADLDVTDHNGRTALMTACLLGHEKKVKYLLKNHDSLSVVDHAGMNAFLDAVISQSNPIIEQLIEHDVDVHHMNKIGDNALLIAVQQQNPNQKSIKTLLENQVDSTQKNQKGKSSLTVAEKKHPAIFKLMAKKIEAEKQIELPMFAPAEESNTQQTPTPPSKTTNNQSKLTEIPERIEPTTDKNSPTEALQQLWFDAIAAGNLGRLNQLKVKGVGIDQTDNKGCSGLIHAAGKGHRAVASYLIQNNANIEHRSNNGSTPMSSAIISNSRALVGLLITNGAEVNGLGPGDYPYLSLAATQWSESCVSMLLGADADINTTDEAGMSLYHHVAIAAEYYGNTAKAKNTLRLINQNGLDINTQNQQGNTALHLICGAMKSNNYKVDDSHIANITHEMLKLGANPKITNNAGFTAIQYAKQHGLLNTNGVILSFLDVW
ncbi:hypothetical protein MNBD_GAMMA02-1650 [hydrothermal vent metagenome]|uniref:Uncharacterized protein n=1 Tax=hydrothermal vent metagenome TaxID=652676 RepID=A0A3B0VLW9_9ZZZZ